MKWFGREESGNVEDRRGIGGKTLAVGGVGGLVLVVLSLLFGVDLTQLGGPGAPVPDTPGKTSGAVHRSAEEDHLASFTKVVFRDTELVWREQFARLGRRYVEPKLVLYDGVVRSSCGTAQAAVGPFYCPGDSRVYIDLSFYRDMERKLQAPGDFARAYVLAHEVGHHVQKLLGYLGTGKSVATELQADFLAGVWAHHAQEKFRYLEPGDIESALKAAFEIGDDRLQKRARGYVVPDSFTHGTSRQRMAAFTQGFESGDLRRAPGFLAE